MTRETIINQMGGFFPEFYIRSYGDLRDRLGLDQKKAWRHYLEYGMSEGRCPNPFFDPVFYRHAYFDLSTLNGQQLLDHWIKHGIREGRRGCEHFWIMFYLKSHKDLVNAFGTDLDAAFAHWKNRGNGEARSTAPSRVLRLYYRRSGEFYEIVARTGAEGSDPELFKLSKTTGGPIGWGTGLVIGAYRGCLDSKFVSGTRIGYGLDRVTTHISKDLTGHFWRKIGHTPIDQVVDECIEKLPNTAMSQLPRITFPNFNMRPSNHATAAQQPLP